METDEPSDADFSALLDEARGESAARSRSARRWLRQQALEEARLSGVLLSAAEQRSAVTIRTTSGGAYAGHVRRVGSDFCVVASSAGNLVYIRSDAITVVQPERTVAALPAADNRTAAVRTNLQEELSDAAPEQPDVSFVCAGQHDPVRGRLVAVGVDVATVEVDDQRRLAYVSLASVTEVSLRPSG